MQYFRMPVEDLRVGLDGQVESTDSSYNDQSATILGHGTPNWAAPEAGLSVWRFLNTTDVFAFGRTTFEVSEISGSKACY